MNGQEGGREVLVDDGIDAAKVAIRFPNDWNPSTAGADHGPAGFEQRPDLLQLDDRQWLGRRNDSAPVRAVLTHRPAVEAG